MSNILVVPLHLDALVLKRDTLVAEAMADFTRLPYFDGQRDVNPDVANISEDIVIQPFQDKNFNLKAGLHLHWSLPDALTKTIGIRLVEKQTFNKAFRENGDTIWTQLIDQEWIKEIDSSKASVMPRGQSKGNNPGSSEGEQETIAALLNQSLGHSFPPVPNRWLVERKGGSLPTKKWVIESDYLYPYGEGGKAGSVNILYSGELFSGGNAEQIGQLAVKLKNKTPLSQWLRDQFSSHTTEQLNCYTSGTPSETLQAALMWELNQILQGGSIYNEARFSGIVLSEETQNVLNSQPQGEELVHLNRLLLEGAYPECKGIGHQPFRYLGRTMSFEVWLQQRTKSDPYRECLEPLTALGDGEPTFAAFYPNCHSVFGFYDGEIQDPPPSDLKYTVVGWYDRPESDYFATFLKHYRNLYQGEKSEPSNAELLTAIAEEFKWTAKIDDGQTFPEAMLCYARIGFEPESDSENRLKNSATQIAVGSTSTEALSAFLGNQIDSTHKLIIEEQLECLHLFAGLEHRKLDLGPKFEEARHEKEFNPAKVGTLWTIRQETASDEADAAASEARERVVLPDHIADALNTLNCKQKEYEKALEEIESRQERVFADWYKYMLCAYPPDDSRDDYPDIDEVKYYIEVKDLVPLEEKLKATGELGLLVEPTSQNLMVRRDGDNNVVTATAEKVNSIASELASAINQLLGCLDTYNQQLKNSIIAEKTLANGGNGHNNSGILHDSPTEETKGPLEKCWSFDGNNDYIHFLDLDNARAVSIWVNIPRQQKSGEHYLLDVPGLEHGQVGISVNGDSQTSNIGDGWNVMYVDGEKVGKRAGALLTWQDIPKDRWVHIYLQAKVAFTGDLYLMCDRHTRNKLKGKIASVRVYNRDLTEQEIDRDRSNIIELNYVLKRTTSPRYWQPNNPAILIEGEAAKFTERHGSDGRLHEENLLECQWDKNDSTSLEDLIVQYDKTIGPKIDAIAQDLARKPGSKSIAFSTWTQQPWHPFLLEWEVEVLPVAQHGNLHSDSRAYAPEFIVNNYELKENATDLSVKPEATSTRAANIYSGMSIVTPHASHKLGQEIEAYLQQRNALGDKSVMEQYFADNSQEIASKDYLSQSGNIEKVKTWYEGKYRIAGKTPEKKAKDPIYTAIRAYEKLQTSHIFAQTLGGFNAGLLMHKQTMQLRIDDPIGFEDYKPFTERVRQAVGDRFLVAPLPLNDFNPIRSGLMMVLRLRLIDTFGQVKADLNPERLILTEKMTPPDHFVPNTSRDWAFLPPRLVQPARLNFRWLSSSQGEQESNSVPKTTPICGWLLPNHLDNSLMVYDFQGNALGSVNRHANWEPAPGSDVQVRVGDIVNSYLRKIVDRLTVEPTDTDGDKTRKRDFFNHFITVLDRSLDGIHPEDAIQHQDLALLMGRPVAVVRASLNLELQGLPAIHQGWNEFRQDLRRDKRDTDNVTRVEFPLRIGEYQQLNDGTIGYWQEEDGSLSEDFYVPHNYGVSDDRIKIEQLIQSIDEPPETFTLLMDPTGKVHASCGIVPTKAIDLPPAFYKEALQNIQITFLSVPILTEAYKVNLPLPEEVGYGWSWLEKDRYTWTEVSTVGVLRKEVILAEFNDGEEVWQRLIGSGWIEEIDSGQGRVVRKDQRTNADLGEDMQDKKQKIEEVLDRSHIGQVSLQATFSDANVLREGWLALKKI